MKKNYLLKALLVLSVAAVLTIGLTQTSHLKQHYVAGDDLPIYIGKSAPRG